MAQSLPELTASDIPTLAFTQALLRTERLRICGSILVTAAFGITGAIRIYLFGSHMKHSGIYYILGFALYEVLVLRLVQRSLRTGRTRRPCVEVRALRQPRGIGVRTWSTGRVLR